MLRTIFFLKKNSLKNFVPQKNIIWWYHLFRHCEPVKNIAIILWKWLMNVLLR